MKKKSLITGLVLSLLFCLNAVAQNPDASTASNPKWYYIQVVGSGTTANRVLTVVDNTVVGQPLSLNNLSLLNCQLWRLELVPSVGYLIINKSTGKRLSVTYDTATQQRIAIASADASTCWRYGLQTNNSGFYLNLASETGLDGTAGTIYLQQTATSPNYGLIFTGSANRTGVNTTFNFASSNIPVASTEDDVVWMYIQNNKTGKYLTDAVASSQDNAYFTLDVLKTDGNETVQQWKLVPKTGGNSMALINRATGNIVGTNTVFDRYYYLQYTNDPEDEDGWNYELISNGQYAVSTTDANGIVKYWYATTPDQPTESYVKDYAYNSAYAWIFSWASEEIITGINPPQVLPDNIRVYSNDKRIYVEGCNDYKIITIYGTPVNQNAGLPVGVYLVITKDRTIKVLVK